MKIREVRESGMTTLLLLIIYKNTDKSVVLAQLPVHYMPNIVINLITMSQYTLPLQRLDDLYADLITELEVQVHLAQQAQDTEHFEMLRDTLTHVQHAHRHMFNLVKLQYLRTLPKDSES